MKCDNCGYNLTGTEQNCPNCGKALYIINQNQQLVTNNQVPINYQNSVQYSNNTNQNINTNKPKNNNTLKYIIIALLSVLLILLIIAAIVLSTSDSRLKDGSRTIMIYMVGSNLESESSIATYDIDSIKPSKIDLDKYHILLYTGGTTKWHNFIKNDENAIYVLTEEGFEQLESYDQKNMGDAETLQEFLDYGYENYKSQYYDLLLYNHGGAIDGAIYDDFTKDNLTLEDFSDALNNSIFNDKNKLNTVLFRTCLNGTIEVAGIFAPYAEYLIASEEVTLGGNSSVLNFLNNLETEDDGIEYGKKFIKAYERQIEDLDPTGKGSIPMYSIIDLSKIDKLYDSVNDYFSSIDVEEKYNNIVKIRGKMYQYGYTKYNYTEYDTVDLYTLVKELNKYSEKDSSEVISNIEEAVVYNWSKDNNSHGLSIYFPYKANKLIQQGNLKTYRELNITPNYYKFINTFNSLSTSNNNSSFLTFSPTSNDTQINEKEFSIQLNEEQYNDYAESIYIIFEKIDNEYQPIYSSDNNELSDDGILRTNLSNNLIKLKDLSDPNFSGYITLLERNSDKKNLSTGVCLWHFADDIKDWLMDCANASFDIEEEKPIMSTIIKNDESRGASGQVLDINNYETIDFLVTSYKILDDNGNYTSDWDNNGVITMYEKKLNNIDFEFSSLDNGDYYCIFKIWDIYGNYYYSKLLSIN